MKESDEKKLNIPVIRPPVYELWNENTGFVCSVNEYELLDVRVQIKEKALRGYFISFKNRDGVFVQNIRISPYNGSMECYPKGFCDTMTDLQSKLI
jgi:hypothetical protein